MTVKLSADPKAKRAKLTEMSKYIARMTDDEKRELIDQCGGVGLVIDRHGKRAYVDVDSISR